MLRHLIRIALLRRYLVLLLAAVVIVHGIRVASRAKLDVLPDFAPPQVSVQTECPGRTAEQIETEVTRPVESAVQGATGLAFVRSESLQGLSLVQVVFDDNVDPYRARQSVSELVGEVAGRLPSGVGTPRLTPLTSATMDLLKIGLLSDRLSPGELRDVARWTIEPHLRAVSGVATVSIFGGAVRRTEIQVHSDRLAAAGLDLAAVTAAAREATGVRASGFVETAAQRIVIHTDPRSTGLDGLRQTVIGQRHGVAIRLSEVADVVDAAAPKFGDCLIQGRPGCLLTMTSQYGANTMKVTRGVEAALEDLRPTLAKLGIELLSRLHRPATFIERALGNLTQSLLLGAILVAAVLLLFLFDLRAACISMTAIPLSLLTAVIVLDGFGFSLDTMALGGLAMALGEVVDDAIIDVENISRRLRQNRLAGATRRIFDVVLDASIEVRGAVVHATLIVTLVFLPVIGMPGLAGHLFAPLGIAYVVAVGVSLAVALIVTPALAMILLGPRGTRRDGARQRGTRTGPNRLARAVGRVLSFGFPRPVLLFAGVLILSAWAAYSGSGLAGEFVPPFREGHFVAHMNMAPGTSIPEMRRVGARVAEALLATGHVATVEQQIGRAELGEDPWPQSRSEFHIELVPMPGAQEAVVEDEIREILHSFPGVASDVLTFLGDRIGETITGETADVVVTVFGEDLDDVDRIAGAIAADLRRIDGASDVQVASEAGLPQVAIRPRPADLLRCGLGPGAVFDAVATAYQGTVVGQLQEGDRVYDVAVTLHPDERGDAESIRDLRLRSASGQALTLAAVADVDFVTGRSKILHEGGRRRQVVTCNASNRPQEDILDDIRRSVAARQLPAGVQVQIRGAAEERDEASATLLEGGLLAGMAVLILLRFVFRNLRNTLLVLTNLPFTFVGGVLALRVTGGSLDMGAMVGFVTLFGITTRNSIMLMSHFEHLVHAEGCVWGSETALRGALERVRPILMTALVTALGLLPIALGRSEAGREIEGPMAVVIVGGICTSTLLNLLVLPALCLRFGRFGTPDPDAVAVQSGGGDDTP